MGGPRARASRRGATRRRRQHPGAPPEAVGRDGRALAHGPQGRGRAPRRPSRPCPRARRARRRGRPPRWARTPRGSTCRARARRRRAVRPSGQHRPRPGPPAGRRLVGVGAARPAGDGGARAEGRERPAHGLAGPRAHEPGRARARPAGTRALPKRPARARVPGAARPDVPLGLGAPGRAHGPARGGAAAGPAGPPLRPVPVVPLAREARPAAPGARVRLPARPAGPVGHLRAQRPREPPPLAVRPAPSPLAVSCQASRVSPRRVFSLTTSWRRRGASSCRRWSNRETVKEGSEDPKG